MEFGFIAVNILVIIALLAGAVSTIIGIPGNLIIMLTALGYGLFEDFRNFNYSFLAVIVLFYVIGEVIEFFAAALGAKKERASKRAIILASIGAVAGGLLGTAFIPIIGSLAGAVAGGFIASYYGEYSKTGDIMKARQVAASVMKGQLTGLIVKFAVAVAMVIMIIYRLRWG